ncbi:protein broad-minded [Protopterus annectens]|uniref:protein broad-minded n=1 Tax=Protopterus annectens TaxID=7888 RepID=UPI001CF93CB6|nr:protein broad-minded [Protopterus annectens]
MLQQLPFVLSNTVSDDDGRQHPYSRIRLKMLQCLVARLLDKILKFYAKTFSTSPLNITREIYTSLAKHIETYFLFRENKIINVASGVDIANPDIARLLKKFRLLNEFQKDTPSFWIRHPEKYMEEIVESTLSLLTVTYEQMQRNETSQKTLEPVHFLAMLDIKATWFRKWMHGYYSRTVVLKLLEKKYKSLIAAAVQQCCDYIESCEIGINDTVQLSSMLNQQEISNKQRRPFYTEKELYYIYFVHSVCLLGRLLIYAHGRKLFPVKTKKRNEPVSLMDLIVLIIRILCRNPNVAHRSLTGQSDSYSPASLVVEVLRLLCDRKECATECLYKSRVLDALLYPISALLKGRQVYSNGDEITLTYIADVLARIASTEGGLSLLLYGENAKTAQKEITSSAHTIVQFTKKLLTDEIAAASESEVSPLLKGAFIFVCRQMYNTCEGLQVLIPYGLHKCIAEAWKKASLLSERAPTPVAGVESSTSVAQELQNSMQWEEMLLDSLLNFAATPKGVLLLQQTGAINECVTYMFSRFTKKLQVSRCEKFGYGVMVTQVAATAPGTVALESSGFIQALVSELWSVLECGRDDTRVIHPKSTPIDPIDRSCQKSFLALANLLSSYYAVYELTGKQKLPNKTEYFLREVPASVIDVIDRLVIINSDAKVVSLFNYEQSHTFGLRLLNVLCCSLDTLLLLEAQYKVSELLLKAQRENVTETSGRSEDFIIDGLSVERNHILVRMNLVGGPSERILPPRALQKGSDPYPWPMFSSLPLPKCYLPENAKGSTLKQDADFSKILLSSKKHEKHIGWPESCRKQFSKTMIAKPDAIQGVVLADLLEKFVMHVSDTSSECYFSIPEYKGDTNLKNQTLSSEQQLGIKMTVRYGRQMNILKDSAEQDLTWLLKHSENFLKKQQTPVNSPLRCLQGGYAGHDWFASSLFLIMSGDKDRALKFLQRFASLLVSAFLWLPRLYASIHLPVDIIKSGIHPLYSCISHYIEMLLKQEVPLVFSAFRMSGFTPSQICLQWLVQCFWNYLDWCEICHYIATCIVLGPDYQVYMCLSVLKHLQPEILQHTQSHDLQIFLKEEAITGFQVHKYLEYMENLEQAYRPMIMTDMKKIRQQSD